jgi:CRISPR-associated protein Csm3
MNKEKKMKLKNIKEITAVIEVKTGLHIGGSKDEIKIGGIDNPVIKNPLTNEPYIPGSSLKGKIRTLLEWHLGLVEDNGKPVSCVENKNNKQEKKSENQFKKIKPIVQLFGNGETIKDLNIAKEIGPTRVSFADCELKNLNELLERNALTEEKMEVTINRITGTVGGGGPRHMERVPAGAEFGFKVTLLEFEGDENLEAILAFGMKLLELTNLGGNGSRGYGKIEFKNIKGLENYTENGKLKSYEYLTENEVIKEYLGN